MWGSECQCCCGVRMCCTSRSTCLACLWRCGCLHSRGRCWCSWISVCIFRDIWVGSRIFPLKHLQQERFCLQSIRRVHPCTS
ncbi:unnamed protein product [Calypogeia fissa]